jgi:hypothetical protein
MFGQGLGIFGFLGCFRTCVFKWMVFRLSISSGASHCRLRARTGKIGTIARNSYEIVADKGGALSEPLAALSSMPGMCIYIIVRHEYEYQLQVGGGGGWGWSWSEPLTAQSSMPSTCAVHMTSFHLLHRYYRTRNFRFCQVR